MRILSERQIHLDVIIFFKIEIDIFKGKNQYEKSYLPKFLDSL